MGVRLKSGAMLLIIEFSFDFELNLSAILSNDTKLKIEKNSINSPKYSQKL